MREQVAPWMIVTAAVVAALLIGFLVWKVFGPSRDAVDQATINKRIQAKAAKGL